MSSLSQRVLAVMLASSFVIGVQIKPAKANPAVLAPALCATGVGCALVGTVAVGGALYYVWEYGGGKRLAADAVGNVLRVLVDPENPEGSLTVPDGGIVYAPDRLTATKKCQKRGYSRAIPRSDMAGGVYYVCQ